MSSTVVNFPKPIKFQVTSEDRYRKHFYTNFVNEHASPTGLLTTLYYRYILQLAPTLSLRDWIDFAFQHTSNDALAKYRTQHHFN